MQVESWVVTIRINAIYVAVCFQIFYTKFKIDFSRISIIGAVWVKNNRKHPYVIPQLY